MRKGFLENQKNFSHLGSSYLYHLSGVNMNFGSIKALQNISLTINPGEVLFITGKSGAGKSTLLNILGADLEPSSGKIHRPGNRHFVSQVFQDLKLFESHSVEDNLWFAYDSKVYKNKNEFYTDLMELASVVGIKDRLHHKVQDANGGFKQKVAMLRALLAKPDIILADEPTAALDKESSMKLFEVLNFYNVRKNLTVVWASHNRDLVKQFPGKILHLDAGKLVYAGHACFI